MKTATESAAEDWSKSAWDEAGVESFLMWGGLSRVGGCFASRIALKQIRYDAKSSWEIDPQRAKAQCCASKVHTEDLGGPIPSNPGGRLQSSTPSRPQQAIGKS